MREGVGPALDALRRDGLLGPKGGNLEGPANSEARRSPLNARTDPQTGLPQLHRFGTNREFQDSATPSRVNEQPWHRLAAYMILAKRTNSEIALAADVTPACVSHLRAQRWFQELLATLANAPGQEILSMLQSEAAASLEALVALRDFADSDRVKADCAYKLLTLSHGLPTQRVVSLSAHTTFSSEREELDEIQREIQALQNQTPTT